MTTTDHGLNNCKKTSEKTGISLGFFISKDIDKSDVKEMLKIHAKKLTGIVVLYQNFPIFEN